MKLRWTGFALAAFLVGAGPAAAQQAAAGCGMTIGSQPDAALFPRICLICGEARVADGVAGEGGAGSDDSVPAPLLGAAIGFVAGIVATVFICNGRESCDMGQIIFPILGAMVGWTLGETIENGPPPLPPY